MKSSILNGVYFGFFIFCFSIISSSSCLDTCDITQMLTKPLTERSLVIWSLLDLAENNVIVDQELFYDELCRASLGLCKEVQQLQENNYILSNAQIETYAELFSHLQARFNRLPHHDVSHIRYRYAIEVIFHYSDFFLKN